MTARNYVLHCPGCGLLEEKRVEGETAPTFSVFRVRTVIEGGARVARADCPLCSSVCSVEISPTV